MLVLSRRAGQAVVLSGGIVVWVNRIVGGRVSLGFEAPETVAVVRRELVEPTARGEEAPRGQVASGSSQLGQPRGG